MAEIEIDVNTNENFNLEIASFFDKIEYVKKEEGAQILKYMEEKYGVK